VPERTWLVRQQIPRLDWSHGIKLPIDVNPRFGKPSWESGAKPYPKDLFRGKRESGPDPGVTEPVFGEGAAGLGTTTRSSASPRLATSTYDSLLVECANHVLGPRGKDSTLRQWGLHLASRGGKQSRNRAILAVARKLAVLLHRIWVTQKAYLPFYAVAA
jgi:hypothetical protein